MALLSGSLIRLLSNQLPEQRESLTLCGRAHVDLEGSDAALPEGCGRQVASERVTHNLGRAILPDVRGNRAEHALRVALAILGPVRREPFEQSTITSSIGVPPLRSVFRGVQPRTRYRFATA